MQPLPFEKAILRRTVPTWQELLCDHIARGSLTKAEVSLGKCRRRTLKTATRRVGVTNALIIVSPGCDCSRLLFYLLLYITNPLHVYDSQGSTYTIDVSPELTAAGPSLCLQNVDMSFRSRNVYNAIFDLASGDAEESDHRPPRAAPQLFHNVKLRSALEMGTRLILVLGLMADEAVTTAKHFAQIIKQICYNTSDVPDMTSVRLPMPTFIDGLVSAQDRERKYIEGGIISIPSRMLLVDLLTAKLAPELVSGIVIVNAHRMTHDYNIPFLIKLVRSRNRLAFVKAITDNVTAMRDEGKLTFTLKSMFTSDCFIFPRCGSCFDSFLNDPMMQPETFEVNLKLSETAKHIHNTIVQVLQRLITDLQRQSGQELETLDMNALMYTSNVKRLLTNALQKASLSASEYHINRSMTSLVNLRILLEQLLNMDAISFLIFAESMKSAEGDSHWLWTSYGNTIYKLATARVYQPNPQEEPGLQLNVEIDQKGDYIRKILCSKHIGPGELGELLKSAIKWRSSKRLCKMPSRYIMVKHVNLSSDAKRAALCRREAKHLRYINDYFKSGGILTRRAIIVAESEFVCNQLRSSLNMSLGRYNEVKFMSYAARRADRYESIERDDHRIEGYTETHYHRTMINSRNETDKMLHRFVVWSKYNRIYRSSASSKDRSQSTGHSVGQGDNSVTRVMETQECLDDVEPSEDDKVGDSITPDYGGGDVITPEYDVETPDRMELVRESVHDPISLNSSSSGSGDSDMDKSVGRIGLPKTVPSRSYYNYSLTLNVTKQIKCVTHVINVYYTQVRNELLKGIMERKLLAESNDDPLPTTCSPQEFGYVLQRIKPTVVIVYRPSVKILRVIEQYCALQAAAGRRCHLRVYVLSYIDCLESHKFARNLKYELECWRYLQQQLKSIQITFDESVLLKENTNTEAQATIAGQTGVTMALSNIAQDNTELQNGTITIPNVKPSPQVLVDMREFNSKLPFHLYYNGLRLVPIQLEIGDYLITRDICIERKSLGDLIGSLNSGRLAQQAEELCSTYDLPFLLVEFDGAESFRLSPCNDGHSTGFNYIYSKLCILCCNYPKLRVIWSQSPDNSAAIVMALKKGRSEPDVATNSMVIATARGISAVENGERQLIVRRKPEDVKNRDALRILRRIPGVTSYNIGEILSRVGSLRQLSEMEEADLCQFLPPCNAKAIFNFFNQDIRGVSRQHSHYI
ncbi:DNA repair protein [Babesia ovis]|uniref:DNA repair protein n=1 Tax=Babesia ovis TaxID=5869 RepID=A0A9W5TD57_BABOV|nr:DNA repair protein [Babesia ovis]